MARKSRKKTGSAVCVSTSPAVKPFSTAIYARLSVENSGKNDDGDSIENQVSICREYIEESLITVLKEPVLKDPNSTE